MNGSQINLVFRNNLQNDFILEFETIDKTLR